MKIFAFLFAITWGLLFVALPYWSGKQLEKHYGSIVSKLKGSNRVEIKILSYDRGFYHSIIKTKVEFPFANEIHHFLLKIKLSHGPLTYNASEGASLGLGAIKLILKKSDGNTLSNTGHSAQIEMIGTFNWQGYWKIESTFKERLLVEGSLADSLFLIKGEFHSSQLYGNTYTFNTVNVNWQCDIKKNSRCQLDLNIDELDLPSKHLNISDLNIHYNKQKYDNELVDASLRLNFDKVVLNEEFEITDFSSNIKLKNINENLVSELYEQSSTEEGPLALSQQWSNLLAFSPYLEVESMGGQYEGAAFDLAGFLKVNGAVLMKSNPDRYVDSSLFESKFRFNFPSSIRKNRFLKQTFDGFDELGLLHLKDDRIFGAIVLPALD